MAFDSLPVEILAAIAGKVANIDSLYALALANRTIYAVVNPLLYSRDVNSDLPVSIFWAAFNDQVSILQYSLHLRSRPWVEGNLLWCTDEPFGDHPPRWHHRGRQPLATISNSLDDSTNRIPYNFFLAKFPHLAEKDNECLYINWPEYFDQNPGQKPLDQYLWSPLHLAIKNSSYQCAEILLQEGLPINLPCVGLCPFEEHTPDPFLPQRQDLNWVSAYHLALVCQDKQMLRLLFQYAGNLAFVHNSDIVPALHIAAFHGNLDMMQFLLGEAQFAVDHFDTYEWTPLAYAAANGHLETAGALLISAGANVGRHIADLDRSLLEILCQHGSGGGLIHLIPTARQLYLMAPSACTDRLDYCFWHVALLFRKVNDPLIATFLRELRMGGANPTVFPDWPWLIGAIPFEALQFLLDEGISFANWLPNGLEAVTDDLVPKLKLLVQGGWPVNSRARPTNTTLLSRLANSIPDQHSDTRREAVLFLLENGADLRA